MKRRLSKIWVLPLTLCLAASVSLATERLDGDAPRHNSTKLAEESKIILFVGDSLTAGYGLDPEEAFPALIQKKIDGRGWNYRVVNAGVSGETTSSGLRQTKWLLKKMEPAVLFLGLGANDGLRGVPVATVRQNLQNIIGYTRSRSPDSVIILAGMKMPPNWGKPYTEDFESVYAELAETNKIPFVPFLLDGVGGEHRLNLEDGIHPTAEGHQIMAWNVWRVVEPVLEKLRAGKNP